ncbi:MAG: response regulator [Hyphomicrobium sp.]|nr:response regulator [Hyphomicrobium sp.]
MLDRLHILVVDDEPAVRNLLRGVFEREAFIVHEAGNGAELEAAIVENPIDLVTLDLRLGSEDGLALARKIRSIRDIPIIIVSAKSDELDRIVGLEPGADDYIAKPFNLREVLARVRAVLRRHDRAAIQNLTECSSVRFGKWTLNLVARTLSSDEGEEVPLTGAEFDLLKIFTERPGRSLSRATLIDLLKGCDATPFDRSIDTLIARVRKKIESDVNQPVYIKTVRGTGYVFSTRVDRP